MKFARRRMKFSIFNVALQMLLLVSAELEIRQDGERHLLFDTLLPVRPAGFAIR